MMTVGTLTRPRPKLSPPAVLRITETRDSLGQRARLSTGGHAARRAFSSWRTSRTSRGEAPTKVIRATREFASVLRVISSPIKLSYRDASESNL